MRDRLFAVARLGIDVVDACADEVAHEAVNVIVDEIADGVAVVVSLGINHRLSKRSFGFDVQI